MRYVLPFEWGEDGTPFLGCTSVWGRGDPTTFISLFFVVYGYLLFCYIRLGCLCEAHVLVADMYLY